VDVDFEVALLQTVRHQVFKLFESEKMHIVPFRDLGKYLGPES
jgi:hypothetical protein